MREYLRVVFVGGALAYRALFNWATPSMFVGTLLVAPLMQLIFYAYLGRQLGVADDSFYVVGNGIMSASFAGVYGGAMALTNERRYGTLGSVLLSPMNRSAIFLGRGLPYAVNGILISVFTLGVGSLILGVRLPARTLPGLFAAILTAALCCAFFGMVIGSVGLRARDIWFLSTLGQTLLLIVTGINVPRSVLPAWLRVVGDAMPVTHAVAGARDLLAGDSLAGYALIGDELLLAVVYAVLSVALLAVFEREARRHATLDLT
jgi:ABC-2 type transport system permease protein